MSVDARIGWEALKVMHCNMIDTVGQNFMRYLFAPPDFALGEAWSVERRSLPFPSPREPATH